MAVVKSVETCDKCKAPRCHSCTIDDCDEACSFDIAICEACRLHTDAATPHYEIPILVCCKCLTIKPGEECPYYIGDQNGTTD